MRSRLFRKVYSHAGESIGETLVALLISAFALMMLAGAVSSGMRIVTNSKEKMDAYYQVNNAMVARATAAPTVNGTAVTGFSGTITVSIPKLLPTGTIPPTTYWKNDQLGAAPVIVYSKNTPVPGT